ncbi:metallophosphoesterase [Verrucomicrobiales bacterium BCK34]|nr:metallophosphoesterase [Verrucomicrobiales bacterium BCK34]
MPVSLIPKSRRHFLQTGALASLGALTVSAESNDNWYALLADTHIDANPEKDARGTNMAANLKQVVAEILAEKTAPDFVVVNGDCAYNTGLKEDYTTLRNIIQPLLDAGIPIHLTMGNHDDRGPFYTLFPDAVAGSKPLKGKHLAVVETEHANWLFLDTLDIVNKVTGRLGSGQLEWLSKTLDQLGEKPILIMGHHNIQYPKEGSTATVTGLADTVEFMDVLSSNPRVKAYFYGHTHSYAFSKSRSGFHLINQPPVAYLFNESRPNGWIKASVSAENLSLTLNCIKKDHELHGENTNLTLA